jgi:ribosome-binding protein aMBF1 (putative translation factor)
MTPSTFDALTSSPRRAHPLAEPRCRALGSRSEPKRRSGQRRSAPVELLQARVFRLRIAHGYSIYDLAAKAEVSAPAVRRLEAGEAVDKCILPALARALDVPLCRLVCGEHDCTERACITARSLPPTIAVRSGQFG